MNCIKCNVQLSHDKMFCPKCGYLNETSASQSSPLGKASRSLPRNYDRRNMLAIAGGILIIISFLLPFYKWSGQNLGGSESGLSFSESWTAITVRRIKDGTFGQPGERVKFEGHQAVAVEMSARDSLIKDSLDLAVMLSMWLTLIGSGLTAVFAFIKHRRTVQVSLFSAVGGICLLIQNVYFYMTGFSFSPFQINFYFGFYFFVIGVICMIVA